MWRSAFVILLLSGCFAGSPALAGQATAVIQVGITITGNAGQTPARAKASGSRRQTTAAAKAAALKRSASTQPRPPQ